jgi:Holliday junction DNA helicase RuvA
MITKMTGRLAAVRDDECRLEIGPFEYQVMLPEAVRMPIQMRVGETVTLHTTEYLEGGPNANKFVPRRIGFLHEDELEFFELFCTVDKIGVKKALKAMARPVRDIANAIGREDAKWLTSLPGIGATTAEQIVTTLKRKVTKFAIGPVTAPAAKQSSPLFDEIYQALLGVGLTPLDARTRLDKAVAGGMKFESAEQAIVELFSRAG